MSTSLLTQDTYCRKIYSVFASQTRRVECEIHFSRKDFNGQEELLHFKPKAYKPHLNTFPIILAKLDVSYHQIWLVILEELVLAVLRRIKP